MDNYNERKVDPPINQNIHDQAKGWLTEVRGGTAYIGEIHVHDPLNEQNLNKLKDKLKGKSEQELYRIKSELKTINEEIVQQFSRLQSEIDSLKRLPDFEKSKKEAALCMYEEIASLKNQKDDYYEDPQFANDISRLAQEINAGKRIDQNHMTQNIHDQGKGWQTEVKGGTAYIGEIKIQGKTD